MLRNPTGPTALLRGCGLLLTSVHHGRCWAEEYASALLCLDNVGSLCPILAVILLSFVLAVGFLLIILSCALWANWLPLLVGACCHCSIPTKVSHEWILAVTFVLAPLPNALFAHCGHDDFSSDDEGSGPVDLGRFLTSIIVVTGFALPIVLAHSEVIKPAACIMSIVGGGFVNSAVNPAHIHADTNPCRLVYATIVAYTQTFKQQESEFD